MLKSITQLVPFGCDSFAENIYAVYLANVGANGIDAWDYLIGYFEREHYIYCPKQVAKFLILKDWNRNNSNFQLLQAIYKNIGWMRSDDPRLVPYANEVKIFQGRAYKDKVYVP